MPDYTFRMERVLVKVFEYEPELLRSVPRWEVEKATKLVIARVIELERGDWRPPLARLRPSDLGFLVLDGLIIRRTEVIGRTGVELVGAGDVLRPWNGDEDSASVPMSLSVEVCESTHLAVLDRDFVETISSRAIASWKASEVVRLDIRSRIWGMISGQCV